ncbi:hypothetical protein F4810DRAFT_698309 [Camillea tinctor]|nr:hypothetical protein F4810DRAFT_698309 [Camillea tinctor]
MARMRKLFIALTRISLICLIKARNCLRDRNLFFNARALRYFKGRSKCLSKLVYENSVLYRLERREEGVSEFIIDRDQHQELKIPTKRPAQTARAPRYTVQGSWSFFFFFLH